MERFEKLAEELAGRDPGLPARLMEARRAAAALRIRAVRAVDVFSGRARELGAEYLCGVSVSEVEADEKHVDCVQFGVSRGRWQVFCVAIADEPTRVRLVGPFRRGKAEGPCSDHAPRGSDVENAVDERVERLIREAAKG